MKSADAIAAGSPPPLVSVGLPVFNGENYLADAIASILAQSLDDFELIISDNASTDGTAAIIERFAAQDSRIRPVRNSRNLGAGPNYDRCFHEARGTFFKWAAHDDVLAPDFLERTVAALLHHPDAVLCRVGVRMIGPAGETLGVSRSKLAGTDAPDASARFGAVVLTRTDCTDFFGLFRRRALVGSQLHGNYRHCDGVLLAEMALRGPFVEVDAPVLGNRHHPHRFVQTALKDRDNCHLWHENTPCSKNRWPKIDYFEYFRVVHRNIDNRTHLLKCYFYLSRWWFVESKAIEFSRDFLWSYLPVVYVWMRGFKKLCARLPSFRRGSPGLQRR